MFDGLEEKRNRSNRSISDMACVFYVPSSSKYLLSTCCLPGTRLVLGLHWQPCRQGPCSRSPVTNGAVTALPFITPLLPAPQRGSPVNYRCSIPWDWLDGQAPCFFLFHNLRKSKRERDKEGFHVLVISLNGHSSCSWAEAKSRSQSFT